MNPAARAALATTLFALVHSALASDQAKARARSLGKKEWVDGTYRIFFVGQALLTFGLLAAYIAKQDRQTIYRVKAPASLLLRAVQGAALIFGYRAAREAGLAKLSGWERVQALRNKGALPKGPAAQGPEEKGGVLTARGPYRWSRHPLNFMPIPFLWANPHLTSRLLGFNLVSTIYLALGSLHEEKRLRAQYGKASTYL